MLVVLATGCGRIDFETATTADARDYGAVVYLPFTDPPSGGSVDDVARSHVVTCTECPTLVAGPSGKGSAYEFDPAAMQFLQIPFTADLDPTGGFTVAVWVNLYSTPPSQYGCFLGKQVGPAAADTYALCVQSLDGAALYHSGTAAGTDNLFGTVVPLNSWHHLAMTWDGTTKRGYFDGAPDGTRAVPVGVDSAPIIIGADFNGGALANSIDGSLDEVLIFDRVLTPAEIAQLAL